MLCTLLLFVQRYVGSFVDAGLAAFGNPIISSNKLLMHHEIVNFFS